MPTATAIEAARGKQPLPLRMQAEKSERPVWKRRESKVVIEDRCHFIHRVYHNRKNCERTGGAGFRPLPADRVHQSIFVNAPRQISLA
jgi:hypothetical protein